MQKFEPSDVSERVEKILFTGIMTSHQFKHVLLHFKNFTVLFASFMISFQQFGLPVLSIPVIHTYTVKQDACLNS